jgi:hypothetical protein
LSPGRSSSHHDVARNLLGKDFTGRFTGTFIDRASRPPVTPQGRDRRFRAVVWRPGLPPAGTAGSDSGKATTPSRVMRRGPFHHHHQPARLPPTAPPVHSHHPAERRLVVPTRPWPTGAHVGRSPRPALLQAVRRHQLNLRRTGNCLARERAVGNEVMQNRSVIPNLTLSGTREPFRAAGQACGPRV